ncbi:leucine--tRNA ligase [candidate division WWE3 bacterium RIFCSPHIGHO2_12_FULL_38_15]|nr:MAG: leucine--tRNA ligase [candidate division WWE3 bacterium RIFCSPHIGHO2_01_FULL_38_45]OGC48921.1 MAG: leucine--tRNA ligase [candidate division WWE3 bacterium RIFCSPHIGHO2_12_FULL_38_15]OGC52972.1 MAG: leucine--tRNA ligase [candidate division WWE3 bacterium RIFCSPLOWO2_01_FULL_37_24]
MSETFDFKKIEENWKDKWYNDNIYEAVDFSDKPKKYILAELPYPSGKFLHVGHMMRYTVPEIYSRYLRMKGYNVMFPMGWDCFGLPAETYAIKEKITPQEAIKQATKDYKQAMQNMGYAIDWKREINTSDPNYYKWTQWMFIKLWKKGLAEIKEMPVWWCNELGVLADEEVLPSKDGKRKISERGGYPVERKMHKQWILKITNYADRLLKDLDLVDYNDSVKQGQINWIGKKEGINIDYKVDGSDEKIKVFTTRPDTNFGATFIVMAPEHPLVLKITVPERFLEVRKYIEESRKKSDLERANIREKTGVFTGKYAINMLTEDKMPIYVGDFVLSHFGTGALVGVPGHDKRDFEFAQAFNLPIKRVVIGSDGDNSVINKLEQVQENEGVMVNSGFLNGLKIEDAIEKIKNYLVEKRFGERAVTFGLRDQIFSRQRYWGEPIPLIYKQDGNIEAVEESDLPVKLPIMKDFLASNDGTSPLERNKEWNQVRDKIGNPAKRETQTMPTWAGSNWYFIRYIDANNEKVFADLEKMKYWLPVDKYFGDAGHTTAHLLYSRFWYKVLSNEGYVPYPEPYQWRMSGGMLLGPDGHKMSKSKGNVVDPKDCLENYGADATRTYLSFIGPYEDTYPWNENGLIACFRLVKNIYEIKAKVSGGVAKESTSDVTKKTTKMLHKLIKKLTIMMEAMKINTSVSEIMIFVNYLKKVDDIPTNIWKDFIKCIAPIMPFMAEELWQEINGFDHWDKNNSVHLQDWPEYYESLLQEDSVILAVQINGKARAQVEVSIEDNEDSIKENVMKIEKLKKYLDGKEIKKVVYVPKRVVNLVI